MDDHRLEDKLDKVVEKIGSIDSTLAAQHEALKDHIRRTNLLEEKVEPIEKHVHMVNGVSKFLAFVGIFIAIIEGVLKILGL